MASGMPAVTSRNFAPHPRSQGLSSLPPLSLSEAEKRDPGNEVVRAKSSEREENAWVLG